MDFLIFLLNQPAVPAFVKWLLIELTSSLGSFTLPHRLFLTLSLSFICSLIQVSINSASNYWDRSEALPTKHPSAKARPMDDSVDATDQIAPPQIIPHQNGAANAAQSLIGSF